MNAPNKTAPIQNAPTRSPSAMSARSALALAVCACLAAVGVIAAGNTLLTNFVLATATPGQRIYRWQLASPTFWSHASAWGGYALHQCAFWWLIWKAQRDRTHFTDYLKPLNRQAFAVTAGGVTLHYLQTQLFYDGLAQDVYEWTAMWSVILLLLVVLLIENRRRGIAFGQPWGGIVANSGAIVRRYHGYYFAWATIYTFWYHPMVQTSGHILGFLYMFLLFTQGALMYTRMHTNRWWTVTLEALVMVHGVLVAFMNVDGAWHMFGFGLAGVFVVTQLWGLGLPRRVCWSIVLAYVAVVIGFYSNWGWADFPRVFRILGGYYIAMPILAAVVVALAAPWRRVRA